MVYIRFHLSALLQYYSVVTSNVDYNLVQLLSICLIFLSQIMSSSSSKSDDTALIIAKSIDAYICRNHVFTCFFRQRHHSSPDNQQLSDRCKFLLILRFCLHYDNDTKTNCNESELNLAKIKLCNKTSQHCLTPSVYKTFYAQHLCSISTSTATIKCQIFVLLLLLILLVIKIKVCC